MPIMQMRAPALMHHKRRGGGAAIHVHAPTSLIRHSADFTVVRAARRRLPRACSESATPGPTRRATVIAAHRGSRLSEAHDRYADHAGAGRGGAGAMAITRIH